MSKKVIASTEGKRKPAAGYTPAASMWETEAFAKRRDKARAARKISKAAKRKNRK